MSLTIQRALCDLQHEHGFVIKDYEVGPAFDRYGYEYQTICSGGPKAEGAHSPAWYSRPEQACEEWYRQVLKAARKMAKETGYDPDTEQKRRLIFRVRPALDLMVLGNDPTPDAPFAHKWPVFAVYSRLTFEFGPTEEEMSAAAIAQLPSPDAGQPVLSS